MARRVSMPAADDLFGPTAGTTPGSQPDPGTRQGPRRVRAVVVEDADLDGPKRPSGRVRHDEKMTVYVTADELLDIEHARLMLRRDHGLAVDRGRLVREALALVLAELEAQGADSALVHRLIEE